MESKRKKEVKWHHGSGWSFPEASHRYLQLLPAYEPYLHNYVNPEQDFHLSSEDSSVDPMDDSQTSPSEDGSSSSSCSNDSNFSSLSGSNSDDDWVVAGMCKKVEILWYFRVAI